jgi:hypothetical protein
VYIWHETAERIKRLQQLSSKYAGTMALEKDLPSDMLELMAETRFFLESISLDLFAALKAEYRESPPLRKYHYRDNPDAANDQLYSVQQVAGTSAKDPVLHRVLTLFATLENKGLREMYTVHVVLDEFERLMQDEPRAKESITPHIAFTISQLSVMYECLQSLHRYQPWAQQVEATVIKERPGFMAQYDTIFARWGLINNV